MNKTVLYYYFSLPVQLHSRNQLMEIKKCVISYLLTSLFFNCFCLSFVTIYSAYISLLLLLISCLHRHALAEQHFFRLSQGHFTQKEIKKVSKVN